MFNAIRESSPGVLVLRVIVAAIVILSTYNPTGTSIFHWITAHPDPTDAWVMLLAVVTIVVNLGLLVAAWNALEKVGSIVCAVLFAAVIYLSFQEGWVSVDSRNSIQWLALILYSVFLGVGLAGAILWRRATGQVAVESLDGAE